MIVAIKPKPPAKHIRDTFDDDDGEDLVSFKCFMESLFCNFEESDFLFFVRAEISTPRINQLVEKEAFLHIS